MKTIDIKFWLAFSRRGVPRATKNAPALGVDERAMHCVLTVPEALFARPSLRAEIKVPDYDFEIPTTQVEVAENALSEVLGTEVIMTVIGPSDGDDQS